MNPVGDSQLHSSSSESINTSQEQLHKQPPPYYPPMPTAPMIQTVSYKFADQPITITCQYCGHRVTTVIEEENGIMPFILCILFAACCCILGCCLIPFCVSGLKDKVHHCPNCQREVGKKKLL